MKIIHIILSMGYGGAENMLVKLVNEDAENEILIITLVDYSPLKENISNNRVSIDSASFKGFYNSIFAFRRLLKLVKAFDPDIIQSWMYHSELMGLIVKLLYPRPKLYWNIRCSTSEWINLRFRNKIIFKILKQGFGRVTGIIVNSRKELSDCIELGYPKEKLIYIPNGFVIPEKGDKLNARMLLQKKFKLDSNDIILGIVTRNHVLKDIDTMLKAFQLLKNKIINVHLLIVGAGFDSRFSTKLANLGIENSIHIYGTTNNVFDVLLGFDIGVLSSRTESFPNAIAEYMLASLPVVSTDVAEISEIVGNTGFVVSPGNPELLCNALLSVINMPIEDKINLGNKARERVIENYSIQKIYNQYNDYYSLVLFES